jgi:hypothetical protein
MLAAAEQGAEEGSRRWRLLAAARGPAEWRAGVRCAGARPYLGARSRRGVAGCGDMMIDGVSRQGCGRSVF